MSRYFGFKLNLTLLLLCILNLSLRYANEIRLRQSASFSPLLAIKLIEGKSKLLAVTLLRSSSDVV